MAMNELADNLAKRDSWEVKEMRMTVRQWRGWTGILISVAVLFVPWLAAQAQTQKIRISLSSRSNTNTSYYVAQARGIFRDEGLEVEFVQINPRLGAMAVLNGDVTFTTSFVSTFRGVVQGLPMKTVFILLKKGLYYLMVRPEVIKASRKRRIRVVDWDATTGRYYAPVNLDDPRILVRGGLDPDESDPRFHQQMVYAVAMTTIQHFQRALGRVRARLLS
jgi:hypothetical protein